MESAPQEMETLSIGRIVNMKSINSDKLNFSMRTSPKRGMQSNFVSNVVSKNKIKEVTTIKNNEDKFMFRSMNANGYSRASTRPKSKQFSEAINKLGYKIKPKIDESNCGDLLIFSEELLSDDDRITSQKNSKIHQKKRQYTALNSK